MNYEPAKIRRFLRERFNDEELSHLCFDYFPDVHNDFATGMRKGQKVQMLLEHCQKQGRWSALIAALERERPEAYADQFAAAAKIELAHHHEPPQRNHRQIFISHAHQDAEFSHRLAAELQARGWQTWIAPDSIRPGEKWLEAINRGLEESGVFLLLLTPHAVRSRWVRDETNVAIELMHDGELTLLPLLLESCDVPPLWRVYQQIPFQDDYKAGLQALVTELQPEMMAQLAQQYRQFQAAMAAGEWSKAQVLGQQIERLYPDYQDVPQMIGEVDKERQRQQAQEKEMASLYWQLQAASEAGNWDVAETLGKQIQAIDKGYRDVARLVDQAVEGAKRQERETQLAQLYGQLQEAVTAEDWHEVLVFGRQIQRLDRGYKDVNQLLALARRELRQTSHRKPIESSTSRSKPTRAIETSETGPASLPVTTPWNALMKAVPVWGWVALGAAIVGFSIWGLGQLGGGDATATTPAPEETEPGSTEIAGLIQTRTPTSDPAPTNTATLRPTEPSSVSADTFAPSPTETPTMTYTPTPTLDPNVPPPDAALHDTWERPADEMIMVFVPGGTFMMGSDDNDEDADSDEKPQHEVTLDSFWIDRTEVTNSQYAECVVEGVCNASSYADDSDFNGENHPVVGVSWEDADDYCRWAEAELPTEAQWEYAARGMDGRIYPWGNEAPTCDRSQFSGCSGDTVPIGSFSPSGDSWVNASDMAGNVWEWVADWYGDYSGAAQTNPTGPETGDKVLRGGSWFSVQRGLRAAFRFNFTPNYHVYDVGFRCAVSPGG